MPNVAPASELRSILLLTPTFTVDATRTLAWRAEGLSRHFKGTIVCLGLADTAVRVGNFEILTIGMTQGQELRNRYRQVSACVRIARDMQRSADGLDLIVTYDPLRVGLAGIIGSKLTGAPICMEVNGNYSSPALYSEHRSALFRAFKRISAVTFARWALRRADGIKTLYDTQLDSYRIDLKHAVTRSFFNFTDTTGFRPETECEPKRILLAGFPFLVKGVDHLLAAFEPLQQQFPDWRLTILGMYPHDSRVHAAVANLPQVEVLQAVPHREVPDFVNSAAIVVLPSRTEAMGRILVEAMAAGRARLGTRVGGIPTVIDDGVDGLLVESGDVPALRDSLQRLMGDRDLRERLGSAARQRYLREFAIDKYFEHTFALYQDVMRQESDE